MKLSFFGAAKTVTGSCHCVEVNGKKILIDCGLHQGRDDQDNSVLDFAPNYIDYLIVTHAHIDHSGRIPLLVKQGFQGQIFTTRMTGELLSIMLRDSAHIQESDAQWKNQKGKRAGHEPVEPLYTIEDAERAVKQVVGFEYGQVIEIFDGAKLRFIDAGHLLGSASVELWLKEGDVERKIVFSGDIGNVNQPIIRDPSFITEADYVVMESTYGDRNHEPSSGSRVPAKEYTEQLAQIIDETFDQGGNVVIPSFAVGRTQELLYAVREMKEKGMVKKHPNFTVCVDSPLASEATKIFTGDLRGYLDEEALKLVSAGEALFTFPGFTMTASSEESKLLNMDPTPKVIISASGMCDAGRIRHHLKHNLWRSESSIVFVGYQAEGTLGRQLIEGKESVKLFGEQIAVNAKIYNFRAFSSHADRDHLIDWIEKFSPKPMQVFVVHGEASVTEIFSETLRQRGFSAHAPMYEEIYDLAENRMLSAGVQLEPKKPKTGEHVSASYWELESATMDLLALIHGRKGGANKDLRKMTNQVKSLMEKWSDSITK
ncbi:MAG: Metallo-beta-lactamase family protein R-specific [Evtepia sp.]|jgi:metallo-beta-lactamase family protein|nr:Metallo-beta-lactamase family protein R-specific [Evtepia sp.]